MKRIKITELPECVSIAGLYTIGVDDNNRSVKVKMEKFISTTSPEESRLVEGFGRSTTLYLTGDGVPEVKPELLGAAAVGEIPREELEQMIDETFNNP